MEFKRDTPDVSSMELAHLRPSSTLEMMDNIFAIFATRIRLFLILGALCGLPYLAVATIYALVTKDPNAYFSAPFLGWRWLASPLQMWPAAAIFSAAFQTMLFPSRPLRFWPLMRAALGQLPQFILTYLLVRLMLEMFGAFAIISLQQGPSAGPLGQMLLLGVALWMVLAMFYFMMLWSLVGPVIMIERRAFLRAVARSTDLMRTRFSAGVFGDNPLRRLLIIFTFPACVWLISYVSGVGASFAISGEFNPLPVTTTAAAIVSVAIDFVAGCIYSPWARIALVAIYVEVRMRREALDMQVRLLGKGEMGLAPEA